MGHVYSWYVVITLFRTVCLDRVARGLDDVSNNRLKYADVPGNRIPQIPLFLRQNLLHVLTPYRRFYATLSLFILILS